MSSPSWSTSLGPHAEHLTAIATTLAIGCAGAYAFVWMSLPMPWLLGAILAALIASRTRLRLDMPRALTNPMRAVLGVAVGSAFGPALVDEIGAIVVSLALVVPQVGLLAVLGSLYYRRLGYGSATAFFSALPGGLLEMSVIGARYGADVPRIVLAQTTRVLLVVYTLPFIIEAVTGTSLDGTRSITAPLAALDLPDIVGMVLVAAAGWWVAARLHVSGAAIIGPMILTAAFHLSGLLDARPPDELLKAAQVVLGAAVGASFGAVTARAMTRTVVESLGYFVVLVTVTAVFALLAQAITDFPLAAALLAFAPGGQAEMNVMALIMGAFVPYVALHHLVRLVLVMAIAPLFMRERSDPGASQ